MNSNYSWEAKSDGNISFRGRRYASNIANGYESVWDNPRIALVVMILCCAVDFTMFKGVLGAFLYDDVFLQWIGIAGLLIGFDVVPIYLGNYYKKTMQGYRTNHILLYIGIGIFALTFFINLWMRIEAKDIMLPADTEIGASTFGNVVTTEEVNPMAMAWAVFGAILPLVTSLASFLVSYFASNPRKQERVKLEKAKMALEDTVEQLEAAVAEYKADENYYDRLIKDDTERYVATLDLAREMAVTYSDYVREMLKEHIGNPVAISQLSKGKREELIKMFSAESDFLP